MARIEKVLFVLFLMLGFSVFAEDYEQWSCESPLFGKFSIDTNSSPEFFKINMSQRIAGETRIDFSLDNKQRKAFLEVLKKFASLCEVAAENNIEARRNIDYDLGKLGKSYEKLNLEFSGCYYPTLDQSLLLIQSELEAFHEYKIVIFPMDYKDVLNLIDFFDNVESVVVKKKAEYERNQKLADELLN